MSKTKVNETVIRIKDGKFTTMRSKNEGFLSPTTFIIGNWKGDIRSDGITITSYTHNPNGTFYRKAVISTDGYVSIMHQECTNDGHKYDKVTDKYFKATTASDISKLSGLFILKDNSRLNVQFKSDEFTELCRKHGISMVMHKSPNGTYDKFKDESTIYGILCDKHAEKVETEDKVIISKASWVISYMQNDGIAKSALVTKASDIFALDNDLPILHVCDGKITYIEETF